MKILATTRESMFHGDAHLLQCSICGENDRNKLKVEDLGLSMGICGDDYSFCHKCWDSRILGKKILNLLGYPGGLKLITENLDIKVIK